MSRTIALFVQHPRCSVQSCNGVIKALGANYNYKLFTKHEIEDNYFNDVDLVCFPGGIGDADTYDYMFKYHESSVRQYIRNGGRYLGICMGAYWASKHFLDIVDSVEAKQYIRRPNTCTKRYYSKAVECDWQGNTERFFFYDGPAFYGDETRFETIARYKNGDPAAIIQNKIGLIGLHLEAEEYWYSKPYLHKHWHQGRHHKLLREFVNRLLEK